MCVLYTELKKSSQSCSVHIFAGMDGGYEREIEIRSVRSAIGTEKPVTQSVAPKGSIGVLRGRLASLLRYEEKFYKWFVSTSAIFSGVVVGPKRSITCPSLPTRNFVKFQAMSSLPSSSGCPALRNS